MIYIGCDIGGTKCAVSAARCLAGNIEILKKVKFPTPSTPDEALAAFERELDAVIGGFEGEMIGGIGISCGGPLDAQRGIILSPPNLKGWDEVHIVERFKKRYNIPVKIENDANACACAEWKYGAGRGVKNMIFLTFGTGLGAGLILDGHLYSGVCDMAGEVGHIRLSDAPDAPEGYGKRGSAEGFCSGGGIAKSGVSAVRAALERGEVPLLWDRAGHDERNITAKLIGDMAEEGDAFCAAVYAESGRHLGQTLALLIDLLNPQLIVIGGIFMRSAGLLLPYMQKVIDSEALSYSARAVRICPAALGERIGDYAAVSVISDDPQ